MIAQTLPIDEALEQTVRNLLAGEQFGVLAAAADGRLHTSTILFAETPDWELVHVIRPATRKAHLSSITPHVAFQVDNRAMVASDRAAFVRVSFEGAIRRVGRSDDDWPRYHDVFAAKFPFGASLLASPEVEIFVLRPEQMRVAAGPGRPVDIDLTIPEPAGLDAEPAPEPPYEGGGEV